MYVIEVVFFGFTSYDNDRSVGYYTGGTYQYGFEKRIKTSPFISDAKIYQSKQRALNMSSKIENYGDVEEVLIKEL